MTDTLLTPTDSVGVAPTFPRGLLLNAQPAPTGWELGGISYRAVCPELHTTDGCMTFTEFAPSVPNVVEYLPFVIESAVECSTLSSGDREDEATTALADITEFALGVALMSQLEDATALPTTTDWVAAVGALEAAASVTGKRYVLHASPFAAAHLVALNLMDPATGLSPAGARWIVSPGYAGDNNMTLYVSGNVHMGVGEITANGAVARRQNRFEVRASRAAIVGYDPCVSFSITIT